MTEPNSVTIVAHDIPHTFILFPRMIADPGYTYAKLAFLMKGISPEGFGKAFGRVADPSLVHAFGPGAKPIERSEGAPKRPRGLRRLLAGWK